MIFALWFFGFVCCWIPFAVAILRSDTLYGEPDTEDYIMCTMIAFLAALIWPLSLLGLGVAKTVRRVTEAVERAESQ